MPIDTSTLGTQNLRTTDGRSYPSYLSAFEDYDREFLAEVERLENPTLNQLALEASTPKLRSAASPWLASAEWRLLLDRVDGEEMIGKRRYRLSDRGRDRLAELS